MSFTGLEISTEFSRYARGVASLVIMLLLFTFSLQHRHSMIQVALKTLLNSGGQVELSLLALEVLQPHDSYLLLVYCIIIAHI